MNSIKKVVLLGVLALIGVSTFFGCNNQAQEEKKPKIVLRSYDEARAYVGKVLDIPIPADYKAPDYIYSEMTKDEKYYQFGVRYPQFWGLGSTDLLDSVMAYPELYEVMIIENKALRASVTQQ